MVIFSQRCLDHISNVEAIVDVVLTEIVEAVTGGGDMTEIQTVLIRNVAKVVAVKKLTNFNLKEPW